MLRQSQTSCSTFKIILSHTRSGKNIVKAKIPELLIFIFIILVTIIYFLAIIFIVKESSKFISIQIKFSWFLLVKITLYIKAILKIVTISARIIFNHLLSLRLVTTFNCFQILPIPRFNVCITIYLLFTQFFIIPYCILSIFSYPCSVCFTNDNRFGRAMRGPWGNRNISGRLFLCPHGNILHITNVKSPLTLNNNNNTIG